MMPVTFTPLVQAKAPKMTLALIVLTFGGMERLRQNGHISLLHQYKIMQRDYVDLTQKIHFNKKLDMRSDLFCILKVHKN